MKVAALFAEALRESGNSDAISAACFADVALRNGLLKNRTGGGGGGGGGETRAAGAKLSAKESLAILRGLWHTTQGQLEALVGAAAEGDEHAARVLAPVAEELGGLLGSRKPSEAELERAWLLYQYVKSEMSQRGVQQREGQRNEYGGIVEDDRGVAAQPPPGEAAGADENATDIATETPAP